MIRLKTPISKRFFDNATLLMAQGNIARHREIGLSGFAVRIGSDMPERLVRGES